MGARPEPWALQPAEPSHPPAPRHPPARPGVQAGRLQEPPARLRVPRRMAQRPVARRPVARRPVARRAPPVLRMAPLAGLWVRHAIRIRTQYVPPMVTPATGCSTMRECRTVPAKSPDSSRLACRVSDAFRTTPAPDHQGPEPSQRRRHKVKVRRRKGRYGRHIGAEHALHVAKPPSAAVPRGVPEFPQLVSRQNSRRDTEGKRDK
jgi:hypothetical protein